MPIMEQLTRVTDQPSFIAFVRALQADHQAPATREEWQNDTIEDFLGAAAAWAEDAPMQLPALSDAAAVWHAFAQFLYSGKIYE